LKRKNEVNEVGIFNTFATDVVLFFCKCGKNEVGRTAKNTTERAMSHVFIFLMALVASVGFTIGIARQQSKKFIELDKTNADQQRQLDDLKRELEEIKKSIKPEQ
jgi:cell division protein FtsB